MNNYFTIHHQVRFLKGSLKGFRFETAFSRFKKTLELVFEKEENRKILLFQARSDAALFVQESSLPSLHNAATFFQELDGKYLIDVELSEFDRVVTFSFEQEFRLIFFVFGPKANAFLFKGDDIIDQFRNDSVPITSDYLKKGTHQEIVLKQSVREKILCREPRFPRHLIPMLQESFSSQLNDDANLIALVDQWVLQLLNNPSFRRLDDGGLCLLSDSIISTKSDKIFEDPNTLIRDVWIQREIKDQFKVKIKSLVDQLQVSLRRYEKILELLEDEVVSEERIKKYETTGHILMTYSNLGHVEQDRVLVENIFSPGTDILIPIKKELSISENAQLYYEKAKGTRKTMVANKDRIREIKKKMAQLMTLSLSLDHVEGPKSLEKWFKDHKNSYNSLVQNQSNTATQTRPWRSFQVHGYEIWIGKSAAGNDELLNHAHKEDIWFHARHVSGSHVLVRMNKKSDYPSSDIIEMVASWAAWYSKAKTSALAPVIYTKRKYVRKPKGSAPGLAKVDKERVILVKPSKPESLNED